MIALEVIGKVGVDINICLKYDHLQSPLQFVSGLGPRKAKHLLSTLAKR